MSEESNIRTWHPTFDFEALMREARKHITELAGGLWSDHNSSDPGITQLEVLAFCIADLSYRTSFDVKHIIAGYKGDKQLPIDLPLADVALPNHPVTITDLRKVLIDMAHPTKNNELLLRNAFPIISEGNEVPFYAVSKSGIDTFLSFSTHYEALYSNSEVEDSPSYGVEPGSYIGKSTSGTTEQSLKSKSVGVTNTESSPSNASTQVTSASSVSSYGEYQPIEGGTIKSQEYKFLDQIIINGLYNIQLEFEDQSDETEVHLKDLNQNYFEQIISIDGQDYEISILFPYWDEINWALRNANPTSVSIEYVKREDRNDEEYFLAVDKLNYDDYFYDYYAEVIYGTFKLNAFIKVKTYTKDELLINGKTLPFTINFLDWNEISNGIKRNYSDLYPTNRKDAIIEIEDVSLPNEVFTYDIRTKFNYIKTDTNGDVVLDKYGVPKEKFPNVLARVEFGEDVHILDSERQTIINALESKFTTLFDRQKRLETEIYNLLKTPTSKVYTDYLDKIRTVFELVYGNNNSVWTYVNKYRNLCEDYFKFSASRVQEIALFGKLIIEPDYNQNELLAEIYFQIDQFLSPLIRFKNLGNMVEKGYSFEEIYKGPKLNHGFIENKDLDNLKRRSVVYTSDLIRIIMDVPGVIAIQDFNISSYIDNRLMGRNVIDCLSLTNSDIYKPRFSFDKTQFEVCTNELRLEQTTTVIRDWYKEKLKNAKIIQLSDLSQDVHNLPLGQDMEIEAYYSIQHDFPEIYGIGQYGLPKDAAEDRKGWAKQLKGFLLPIEQLLANYLKQVAHLPELFSYNRDVDTTYPTQPLYNVPDVQPLFTGIAQNPTAWDQFKQDLDNVYQKEVRAGESEEDFRSRRNRFLSQLIARFGETFESYAIQMFDQHKALLNDPINGITQYQAERGKTLDKLIEDKILFGEDYQQVSGERYQSFNTTLPTQFRHHGSSQLSNIGSYKRRLCRLLGIRIIENEELFGSGLDDNNQIYDREGMHIVEHVLLRPRTTSSNLLEILNRPNPEGGSFVYDSDKDPYSFQITIVLPIEADRFKNLDFRKFTERLIRMETPAHIVVNFRWMSSECGRKFEEVYLKWKKGLYLLRPYHFQGLDKNNAFDATGLVETYNPSIKHPIQAISLKDTKYSQQIFTLDVSVTYDILKLSHKLIEVLNTPCTLSMKVYDQNHQLFSLQQNIVKFEQYTTDVFHVRVSETGGDFRIQKYSATSNSWLTKKVVNNLDELYFDLTTIWDDPNIGVTEKYGGTGFYNLLYKANDGRTVSQIIVVTKAVIPPKIYIGTKEIMLGFDTEKDGTFLLENGAWNNHILQFYPYGKEGLNQSITISSSSKGLAPTPIAPVRGSDNIGIETIYNQYGIGDYRIEFENDGLKTFANISLSWNLSMLFYGDENQILPEGDLITISNTITILRVAFNPPFGNFAIYSLDEKSIIEEPNGFTEIQNNFIYKDSKIEQWFVDRPSDNIFRKGGRYKFEYTIDGQTISQEVYFEPMPVIEEPERTTIKIIDHLSETVIIPEENRYRLVFDYRNAKPNFEIQFRPSQGELEIMDEDGNSQVHPIDSSSFILKSEEFRSSIYQCIYHPHSGEVSHFELDIININPTFELKGFEPVDIGYYATGIPLYPDARTYIWRLNGQYVSRAKNPSLELNFKENESIEIELTMHYEDYEASYRMKVTMEMIEKLMNAG